MEFNPISRGMFILCTVLTEGIFNLHRNDTIWPSFGLCHQTIPEHATGEEDVTLKVAALLLCVAWSFSLVPSLKLVTCVFTGTAIDHWTKWREIDGVIFQFIVLVVLYNSCTCT